MTVRPIDGEALWDKLEDALWYDNYDRDMAEKIVLDMPTLTPPNEPLTLDKKRVIAESCLHYGKSGRCGLNGYAPLDCPMCKEWHSNESNEPLTIEQLRKMDGEPVWGKSLITGKPGEWFIVRIVEMSKSWFIACAGATQGLGDKDTYGKTWLAYRRPPEGEGA